MQRRHRPRRDDGGSAAPRVLSAFTDETDEPVKLWALALAAGAAAIAYATASIWDASTDALLVVPLLYAGAIIGASTCALVLRLRGHILDDPVPRWLAAAFGIAAAAALAQGLVLIDVAAGPSRVPSSGAGGLYLLWHLGFAGFIAGALLTNLGRGRRGTTVVRRVLLAAALVTVVHAAVGPAWPALPELVDAGGRFTPVYHRWALAIAVLSVLVAITWIVRCGPRPSQVEAWVSVALILAAADIAIARGAGAFFEPLWWASASVRTATFTIPAAGLLGDAARSLRLLRRHERSLAERLAAEVDRVTAELDAAPAAPGAAERVGELLASGTLRCAYQPIYSLTSGELIAVESLARFPDGHARGPDVWFAEVHAVGRGVELELAAVDAALCGARELPVAVPLTVNVSPEVLCRPELLELLDQHPHRSVIVEVTEHAPVDDYNELAVATAALRDRGGQLAIDDAGAGFASLRHIVRLVPDIIKLDMTLTRDIHLDPVRRSLASSLTTFAERIGALLIAEGVERHAELEVWQELGAHAAQGYLLGRPGELPVPDHAGSVVAGRRGEPRASRIDGSASGIDGSASEVNGSVGPTRPGR